MSKQTKSIGQQIAEGDFSPAIRRTLAKQGITLIDTQLIPGPGDLPWANASRAYVVDDCGTCRVWSYQQVKTYGTVDLSFQAQEIFDGVGQLV